MERPCTILIADDSRASEANVSVNQLKEQLEKETINVEDKIKALKKVILLQANGEMLPQLLMSIIRFVIPSKNKTLKKLVLLYWETVDKTTPDGKSLLPEMILVCNYLRNDLIHPNEFIRGSTLRFLTKVKEAELLEPLVPSVRQNLEHRHSYVRKNALLALYSIYKNHEQLCPDAPELVQNILAKETDASCRRNAFLMLYNTAPDRAIEYLASVIEHVSTFPDVLQLSIIELVRSHCRSFPQERSKYIKCIFTLLGSTSPAVQFEAAGTLVWLSSAPTAVKAASSTYINLLASQSDNNIKMIVLDHLYDLKEKHPRVLEDQLMDLLRALASPNIDVKKKVLEIGLELVSARNIEEVVQMLKKEINKTQSKEFDKGTEYRQMLIQAIHSCAVKFPDVASNVVHILMEFLGDSNVGSAVDVIIFVKEVMETYPALRASLLEKLSDSLRQIKASRVYRAALWIIAEFSQSSAELDNAMTRIKEYLGIREPPFFADVLIDGNAANSGTTSTGTETPAAPKAVQSSRVILPDGTYATQSAFTEATPTTNDITSENVTLRSLIVTGGDYFLASVVASALTKIVLKARAFPTSEISQKVKNSLSTEVLLILVGFLRLGQSTTNPIDPDSADRISVAIRVLSEKHPTIQDLFMTKCHQSFATMLKEQTPQRQQATQKKKAQEKPTQVDDLIKFRQLSNKKYYSEFEEDEVNDLSKATGNIDDSSKNKLNRLHQLTGFSDPIYAEAYITVHQYDIKLDVLVINQTSDTLQNVCLELATLGALKLVERPQYYTLAKYEKKVIKAAIKVSSMETGIIFGSIVYDIAGKASVQDKNCVILNDIHIDIMDYMAPAYCTDSQFRTMWAEFEWENKVTVNTQISEPTDFLSHIVKSTNMKCLTSDNSLSSDCGFLSANLYAKSIFGEDALANVSIEKQPDGKIGGLIRIRSKTKVACSSLGEKITMKQKGTQ